MKGVESARLTFTTHYSLVEALNESHGTSKLLVFGPIPLASRSVKQ